VRVNEKDDYLDELIKPRARNSRSRSSNCGASIFSWDMSLILGFASGRLDAPFSSACSHVPTSTRRGATRFRRSGQGKIRGVAMFL